MLKHCITTFRHWQVCVDSASNTLNACCWTHSVSQSHKHPTKQTNSILHLFIISLLHKPGWTAVQYPSLLVVGLDQPPHTLDQLVPYDHQSLLSESLHHQTTRALITAHCTHIMVVSPLTLCTRNTTRTMTIRTTSITAIRPPTTPPAMGAMSTGTGGPTVNIVLVCNVGNTLVHMSRAGSGDQRPELLQVTVPPPTRKNPGSHWKEITEPSE